MSVRHVVSIQEHREILPFLGLSQTIISLSRSGSRLETDPSNLGFNSAESEYFRYDMYGKMPMDAVVPFQKQSRRSHLATVAEEGRGDTER